MVKSLRSGIVVSAMALLSVDALGESITNVSSIVGVPLTPSVLSSIQARSLSSEDKVVLGNIKAMVAGRASDQAFYFSDELRTILVGTNDVDHLGCELENGFAEIATGGAFSNFVVVSTSRSLIGSKVKWDMAMQLRHSGALETNAFSLVLVATNSQWRVDDLIFDGYSVRTDL